MRAIAITTPAPIVKPNQVPGNHAADDALVTAMIAAAQAEIDGPSGWLGRALGEQVIEVRSDCWPAFLPCRPIIDLESVTVDGQAVENVTVDFDGSLVLPTNVVQPHGEFRARYRAGYDGKSAAEGGTGAPPANAVAAIILMTQELLAQAKADGGLRSVTVDDVITHAFNSPDMVQRARTAAVDRLLAPLRVYVL